MVSNKVKNLCRFLTKSKYGFKQPELFINLTYQCPLRCKFCYVNYTKNKDFSLEDLCYLFEEGILKTSNIKLVTFFGGEPLLKIDYIERILELYYKRLCELNIHLAVITSFSVNANRHIELIKKYPLFETLISFDNYSEERVFANQKPFKVLNNINLEVLSKYKRNICFHEVIDNNNSIKDINLLRDIYNRYGILYSWCWNKTPTNTFDFKDEYKEMVRKIVSEDSYLPLVLTREIESYLNRQNYGCGIGFEFFISSNCDVSPCSISHHNNLLLMQEGVLQEEVPEEIQNLTYNIYNNENCAKCSLKGFCNGGCLMERIKSRNDFNSVNPFLCQRMNQLYQVYNELFNELTHNEIEKIMQKIYTNNEGVLEYCYDRSINIDMYKCFELGD